MSRPASTIDCQPWPVGAEIRVITRLADGTVQLSFATDRPVAVEYSQDLIRWESIGFEIDGVLKDKTPKRISRAESFFRGKVRSEVTKQR